MGGHPTRQKLVTLASRQCAFDFLTFDQPWCNSRQKQVQSSKGQRYITMITCTFLDICICCLGFHRSLVGQKGCWGYTWCIFLVLFIFFGLCTARQTRYLLRFCWLQDPTLHTLARLWHLLGHVLSSFQIDVCSLEYLSQWDCYPFRVFVLSLLHFFHFFAFIGLVCCRFLENCLVLSVFGWLKISPVVLFSDLVPPRN